jgi:hypothetical protein
MTLKELSARRAMLIQRIDQQRNDISTLVDSFERPLSFFDKGYVLMQKIRQQPKTFLIGALIFAMVFRKTTFRIGTVLLPISKLFLLKK